MGGVDDEAYVQRLFEILSNPHPAGIDPDDPYGQADDGIDRYDGFGRDVWVESLKLVGRPHGPEAEIEFGLAVPPEPQLQGLPHRGTVRVPVEAEWRQLSGYADPAAYAPAVARAVERAARSHVERHQGRKRRTPVLPSREEQWRLLVAALSAEGVAREVVPGRIEFETSDGPVVTIVVSAAQWEVVLREHAWGDVELYVAELLGPRRADEVFVVFHEGELWRSIREKVPPVRGTAWTRPLIEPGG